MTQPLGAHSPRRDAARRFGVELRSAMQARGIGAKTLAPQVPVSTSAIACWRAGDNLPTLRTALKLAESLQWPVLLEIARAARSGFCPVDGVAFVNEGGKPKIYCSQDCRDRRLKQRQRAWQPEPDTLFAAEVERLAKEATGGVGKKPLRAALATFRADRPKSRFATLERTVSRHQAAVEAFCRSCEWDGFCKTPECELRPVSPLPLAIGLEIPEPAKQAPGAWGPENREHMLAAVRAVNEKRWSQPGAREQQAEKSRRWWEALSPLERVAMGRRISERRRAKDAKQPGIERAECGCAKSRLHGRDCPLAGVPA